MHIEYKSGDKLCIDFTGSKPKLTQADDTTLRERLSLITYRPKQTSKLVKKALCKLENKLLP